MDGTVLVWIKRKEDRPWENLRIVGVARFGGPLPAARNCVLQAQLVIGHRSLASLRRQKAKDGLTAKNLARNPQSDIT